MSHLLVPPLPPTPPQHEKTPFYGRRYLHRRDAEGNEYLEEVPLTLEDVLYPQIGDRIPKFPQHQRECSYLSNVLRNRFFGDPSVAVLSDCLIDWGVFDQRNHQPDFIVVKSMCIPLDPEEEPFCLNPSCGRVVLVMELISPHTRENDVVRKPVDYHRLGIPLYVLIDQQRTHGPRFLHGYRWTPNGYEEQPLDTGGRLLLEPVGLLLALEDGWVACYDEATGERLGDYQEITEALQEERKAHQEAAARQAAEERQRQETAARQAAEERAAAEAARARAAEERLRELEAELRRLRGDS